MHPSIRRTPDRLHLGHHRPYDIDYEITGNGRDPSCGTLGAGENP